jgi:hypothetical protein
MPEVVITIRSVLELMVMAGVQSNETPEYNYEERVGCLLFYERVI